MTHVKRIQMRFKILKKLQSTTSLDPFEALTQKSKVMIEEFHVL